MGDRRRAQMTPAEDELAHRLAAQGTSFRQVGQRLDRSNKTIAAAVDRHKRRSGDAEGHIRTAAFRKVCALDTFAEWLAFGRQRGYDLQLMERIVRGKGK